MTLAGMTLADDYFEVSHLVLNLWHDALQVHTHINAFTSGQYHEVLLVYTSNASCHIVLDSRRVITDKVMVKTSKARQLQGRMQLRDSRPV